MPNPDPKKILCFTTSKALGHWLETNHAIEDELWVKVFKVKSGVPSVTWDDIVIESLCWGWIDGIKKSIDEQAYLQRISPRRPRSIWSKRNIDHVERLLKQQRMQQPGLVQVEAAKADGRWQNAYAVSEMVVPQDFLAELASDANAQRFYDTLSKSSRNVIAYGLSSAKKPETRQKRFDKYLMMLGRAEKP